MILTVDRSVAARLRSLRARARAVVALVAGLLALVAGAVPAEAAAGGPHAGRVAAKVFDARTRGRLDRALRRAWASTWAPGVIAGVWVGDRGWTSAIGARVRASGPRPVLADHTRVGSVTKTMVGTVILKLVDQGRLRLDEPIARWFPQLPDASQITIRDLGQMSSGITSYTTSPAFTTPYFLHPTMAWNPSQLIADSAALPRLFAPGHGFNYSDVNFVMLGQIIERVTGRPLAQVMRTMLFKPLGMRGSSYPTTNRLPTPFLRGYTVQGSQAGNVLDSTSWSPSSAAGAGAVISTLGDLHRWTVAVGTGALLSPATQRARLIPNPASRGCVAPVCTGVGKGAGQRVYLFALGRENGWLAHEGQIPGYNTQIAYLPSRKAAIVVIANSGISTPQGVTPVPVIFNALARVIAPGHVPLPPPGLEPHRG